ncbi:unnamed protein product [Prunus armeniaca]
MGLETKINKSAKSLTGFNGATMVTLGTIELDVYAPPVISSQTFMVVDEVSPYNGILGRPWIDNINAITFATHQKIRYPIPRGGICQINSDQAMARKCSTRRLKRSKQTQFLSVNQVDLRGVEQTEEKADPDQVEGIRPEVSPEKGWKPNEDVELVPFDPDKPERKVWIGSGLSQKEKAEFAAFLWNNKDVFAWLPSDIPGIDPQIICHCLHVNPAIRPVAQKRRNFAPERVPIIEAEIDKLLAAGFI